MSIKSTKDRYGAVAVTIHWVTAIAIVLMLASGLVAANALTGEAEENVVRIHVVLGISVVVLTVLRIVWWLAFDRRPEEVGGMPRWQSIAANAVHYALYAVILLLGASGIGLVVLSGAFPVLFGGSPQPLPDFEQFPPLLVHGLAGRIMLALFVLHVAAALFHQFVRRDHLLARMGVGPAR